MFKLHFIPCVQLCAVAYVSTYNWIWKYSLGGQRLNVKKKKKEKEEEEEEEEKEEIIMNIKRHTCLFMALRNL